MDGKEVSEALDAVCFSVAFVHRLALSVFVYEIGNVFCVCVCVYFVSSLANTDYMRTLTSGVDY